MPDINPGYKITFSENKKDMSLITSFFIFIFFVSIITSTHIISSVVSLVTCALGYIYCHYKIKDIWPESGSLLLFSKNKVQMNLSNVSELKFSNDNLLTAQIMASSIHNERFIALRFKIQNTNSNNKSWLILKRESMNTTDFTRLRRMLVALKVNQQSEL